MVSDLVVGCCKLVTVLPTNGRSVCSPSVSGVMSRSLASIELITLLSFITFVKFIYYIGATVHDRVGLVLGY